MRQELRVAVEPGAASRCRGLSEMLGVPIYDDGREQVETRHAIVLLFGGAIPDFTLTPDAQGVFNA